jgi:Bax protein
MLSTKKLVVLGIVAVAAIVTYQLLDNEDPSLPNIEANATNELGSLPDFAKIADVKEKKETFFTTLYPIIEEENKHILKIRNAIIAKQEQGLSTLQEDQMEWLAEVAEYYRVTGEIDESTFKQLLEKVAVIPPSLALTQAAIESGWGSSRFSKEGNNLFGQWCFTKGCGMVPSSRDSGKSHEVAEFDSVNEAVRAYLKNLNTNTAYQKLRDRRAVIMEADGKVTGIALAQTLIEYSEEREKYIAKVTKFINQNKLQRFTEEFNESLEEDKNELALAQ